MKIKSISYFIVAAIVFLNLAACSTIKTWFPDKEKDYQFTTEIPPLILPPDLAGDAVVKPRIAPVVETAKPERTAPVIETVPAIDRKAVQLELVDAEQGTKRLRIGAPSATAWRLVGKALSRKSLEVTNRSQEAGLFHVQYDPNKKDMEDDSIWDEIDFALSGFKVTEQEYVLKLLDNNQQTDLIILNKDQQPVTDSASLKLLTLLHDTIKADLAK
jgi:outer membrane protein assembly factor BamC